MANQIYRIAKFIKKKIEKIEKYHIFSNNEIRIKNKKSGEIKIIQRIEWKKIIDDKEN